MPKYHQGKFKPKNPKKYKGNPTNIIYRSSWEKRLMAYFDSHPDVILWQSEECIVKYISPIDGKPHRYFPDFLVKMKNRKGQIITKMVEVKPLAQTLPPKKAKRKTKRYINEVTTYLVNEAKWKAAEKYCEKRNWQFEKITEKEIYGKKK